MHRDLKPSNVILARDGIRFVPRIVDFGLAKAVDIQLDNAISVRRNDVGIAASSTAPEQIVDSKNVDARADLYSVAAMLLRGAGRERRLYSGANLVERHARRVGRRLSRVSRRSVPTSSRG